MFTQDDLNQDICPIIGNSIKVTTMRDGQDVVIGCCVIGKGSPLENGGGDIVEVT